MTASDVPNRVITNAMQTESKNRKLSLRERKRPSHHLQQGNHRGLSESRSCWAEPAFATRQIRGGCCWGAAPTCSVMRFHRALLSYNMQILPKCGWLYTGYSLEYSIMTHWLSIWQNATAELNGNPQSYLATQIFMKKNSESALSLLLYQAGEKTWDEQAVQSSCRIYCKHQWFYCSKVLHFHWRPDAHGIKSLLKIPIINWCCAKLSSGILSSKLSHQENTKTQKLNQPGCLEFNPYFKTDLKGGLGELIEFSVPYWLASILKESQALLKK